MKNYLPTRLYQVFVKDFNLSLFISFCFLSVYHRLSESIAADDAVGIFRWVIIPSLNGFLTGGAMLMLNSYFAGKRYTALYYSSDKLKLLAIAFLAGAGGWLMSFSLSAAYLITIAVIFATASRLKNFIGKLSRLLSPRRLPTPSDVGAFFNFFITLIITFAVVNLSLNSLHLEMGLEPAFNFQNGVRGIADALYFSVITMTTVGYGDIIPQSVLARIMVALECMVCYLTLGLMIGIISRGISFHTTNKRNR